MGGTGCPDPDHLFVALNALPPFLSLAPEYVHRKGATGNEMKTPARPIHYIIDDFRPHCSTCHLPGARQSTLETVPPSSRLDRNDF